MPCRPVPEREILRVMRHASTDTSRQHYAPGTVQEPASITRKQLATPNSRPTDESPTRKI
jgi:hypothetical protein